MKLSLVSFGVLGLASIACSTGGSGPGAGGSIGASALDGTWDITSVGGKPLKPSSMTYSNGTLEGEVVFDEEGQPDSSRPGCTRSKSRYTFSVSATGTSLAGAVQSFEEWTGANCPNPKTNTTSIAGIRTRTAASSDTDFNGDWDVTSGDDPPFVVTVDGLSATAIGKQSKALGKPPTVTIAIAGGIVSVTSKESRFSFAARKR